MFDPIIEQRMSGERVRVIVRECVYRYPTNEEKAIVERNPSVVTRIIKQHLDGELSIVTASNILQLIDSWKDLAVAFLCGFLRSEHTFNLFYQVLLNMNLTEKRLDVCMSLMIMRLLPCSMVVSTIITKLLSMGITLNKRMMASFCQFLQMMIMNTKEINAALYIEIESFCREYSSLSEAEELLKTLEDMFFF